MPAFWKETGFLCLIAVPKRRPKVFTGVVVLGYAASQADFLHYAFATYAFKLFWKPFAKLLKSSRPFPDFLKPIGSSMAEDHLGYSLTYAAERIRTIGEDA